MSTARQEFRRLRRSSDQKVIAGLCAGVGREVRVDPIVLRVVLCLLTLYSGIGLLFYLIGWLLIPLDEGESGRAAGVQRWRFVFAVVLGLLGLLIVPWWDMGWHNVSLALITLLGVYALMRRESPAEQAERPTDSAAGTAGTEPAGGTGDPSPAPPSPPAQPGPATAWPATPGMWNRPALSGEDAVHTMPLIPGTTSWSPSGDESPEDTDSASSAGQQAAGPPGDGRGTDQQDGSQEQDQQDTQPVNASWRGFAPAPSTFWEQPDPLGLRDPWQQPDPLGLHDDERGAPAGIGERGADDAGAGRTTALPTNVVAPTGRAGESSRPRGAGRFLLPMFTLLGVIAATGVVGSAAANPPASAYVAASLGVIGLGLFVGTWVGRSVTLIVLGMLGSIALVPLTITDLVQPEIASGDYGSIHRSPATTDEIAESYDLGTGEIQLDLTEVSFADDDIVRTAVDLGTGEVVVVVPPEVDVELNVDVGVGGASLFGKDRGGWDHGHNLTDLGDDGKGGGKLELRIDSGFGDVEVRRAER